jgi:hypothetical protein
VIDREEGGLPGLGWPAPSLLKKDADRNLLMFPRARFCSPGGFSFSRQNQLGGMQLSPITSKKSRLSINDLKLE